MFQSNKLIELRRSRGISQEQIAEMAGLSRSHYASVESGKRVLTDKMSKKVEAVLSLYDKIGTVEGVIAALRPSIENSPISVRDINGSGNAVGHGAKAMGHAPEPSAEEATLSRLLSIIESQQRTIEALAKRVGNTSSREEEGL